MKTTNQLQATITRNQARVIDLLQWNAEMYAAHIYNSGLQYLAKYIGNDEEAINLLTPRTEFWNWWKLLFNARDEAFIDEWDGFEDSTPVNDLRTIYYDLHNPAVLACEIKPPSIVYGKSFVNIEMATA